MTDTDRSPMLEARGLILDAANKRRVRWSATPLRARHINQAVAIVRHWGLVDDDTLIDAGFKPRRHAA